MKLGNGILGLLYYCLYFVYVWTFSYYVTKNCKDSMKKLDRNVSSTWFALNIDSVYALNNSSTEETKTPKENS